MCIVLAPKMSGTWNIWNKEGWIEVKKKSVLCSISIEVGSRQDFHYWKTSMKRGHIVHHRFKI